MKILCVGDIVGRPGRRAARELMPKVIDEHMVDFVVVNGENAAGGFGMTPAIVDEIYEMGAHVISGGNHTWDKSEVFEVLDHDPTVLRPDNYPEGNPGHGTCIAETAAGIKVGVINLEGRVFMNDVTSDPFRRADALIEQLSKKTHILVLDFHAEATSEKVAMGWYVDGRVSMMVGTHTHIQTADEKVLPEGTAYITDIGMCGPDDSVIGIKKDVALKRFLTGRSVRLETAKKKPVFRAVLADVDEKTGKAASIRRFQIPLEM